MSPRFCSRRKETKLRAESPRRSRDLWRAHENLLDLVDLAVRLGERRPAGAEVVEHERAFVDLREEARRRDALHQHAGDDEQRRGRNDPPRVAQSATPSARS